jgi:PAS domain S-box-containing protein
LHKTEKRNSLFYGPWILTGAIFVSLSNNGFYATLLFSNLMYLPGTIPCPDPNVIVHFQKRGYPMIPQASIERLLSLQESLQNLTLHEHMAQEIFKTAASLFTFSDMIILTTGPNHSGLDILYHSNRDDQPGLLWRESDFMRELGHKSLDGEIVHGQFSKSSDDPFLQLLSGTYYQAFPFLEQGQLNGIVFFSLDRLLCKERLPLAKMIAHLAGVYLCAQKNRSIQIDELSHYVSTLATELDRKGRMLKKLSILSDISKHLLSIDENYSLKEKINFLVKHTALVLDSECCSFFSVEENRLVHQISYFNDGIQSGFKHYRVRLNIHNQKGKGLTGYLAFQKKVFNAHGKTLWDHPAIKNRHEGAKFLPSRELFSELVCPLLHSDQSLNGLLITFNKKDAEGQAHQSLGFSPESDEFFIRILATQLQKILSDADLRSYLKNYELLIENIPDFAVITDARGVIEYMNECAKEWFGDLIGHRVEDYFASDHVSTARQKADRVFSTLRSSRDHSLTNHETLFKTRNDIAIPVSLNARIIMDRQGKPMRVIALAKDLREIKALINVGDSLLSTHDEKKVFDKIVAECRKIPNSNRVYLRLYDPATDSLKVRAISSVRGDEGEIEPCPTSRGMSGYVFKNRIPYLSNDVLSEAPDRYYKLFDDVQSQIVVPIQSRFNSHNDMQAIGIISVTSDKKNAFSERDTYFLTTLANQAATAIDNVRLISKQEQSIRELSVLEMVLEVITKTLDFDQILEGILDAVTQIMGFDYATISLVKKSSGMIGTVKSRNIPDEWKESAWHSMNSQDIQVWVVKNKRMIKLSGWDERLDPEIYNKFGHENLVRVIMPILAREEALGTLETGYYKHHKENIDQDEITILRKVVNLVGIGIEQVNMKEEQLELVQKLKMDIDLRSTLEAQLEALNQASIYLQSSQREDEAIDHIFQTLTSIGYAKGMVSLVDDKRQWICGRYAMGKNWQRIKAETKRRINHNDILGQVVLNKKPKLSSDCINDPSCDKRAVQKAGIISQYIIPLLVNNEAIGTLQIDLSDMQDLVHGDVKVLQRRMRILDTFASQSAIAIRNARDKSMIENLQNTLAETAHEFKSPLHNILSQISGLRWFVDKHYSSDDQINQYLVTITDEIMRAKRQMQNALLLPSLSQGAEGYFFETIKIQDIIESAAQAYKSRALKRGISIVIRDNVKRLPAFRCDRQKIEHVISNILDNAVKYSHANRYVKVEGFDDGTRINISIWDKGQGIPEQNFDTIFKGFNRGTVHDKTRYIPGTGLGLKICKEIVQAHGGQIKVASTPFFDDPQRQRDYEGYDTIFTIILPKIPKEN